MAYVVELVTLLLEGVSDLVESELSLSLLVHDLERVDVHLHAGEELDKLVLRDGALAGLAVHADHLRADAEREVEGAQAQRLQGKAGGERAEAATKAREQRIKNKNIKGTSCVSERRPRWQPVRPYRGFEGGGQGLQEEEGGGGAQREPAA